MLIYIVDFAISGDSGKNKATKEKAKALEMKFGNNNFNFIHPKLHRSKFRQIISKVLFDFSTSYRLFFLNEVDFVIQRVLFMPITRIILYIKRVKVISEYHADFKEEIQYLDKSIMEKYFLYLLSWFYDLNYKLSDGIIFNHPYLQDKFADKFKKPSIYSYNGSNVTDFKVKPVNECRKLLSLPLEETIFLFLGSVSQWHGVDYLIDIFNSELLLKKENIKLYIVGGKENTFVNLLKTKSINKNIIFEGPVNKEKAINYINSANFCLLPVKQIRTSPGSPLKLYDYIACGKPVITQIELLGYSDEVQNYNLGFTLDFSKTESASKSFLEYSKTCNTNSFRSNNRKIAETEVSWCHRIESWCSFLKTFNI
jgi:glycosyltransferase involved in cell wall biosynthesis